MSNSRYVVAMSFRVYGEQEEAMEQAQSIADMIESKFDNNPKVFSMTKHDFGELEGVEIQLDPDYIKN